ncbi:MAG: transposase [Sciscionella sp.]
MAESRRRYDPDFRAGAIRIVVETGKSCAEVARDLGINETRLATWVSRERAATRAARSSGLGECERDELARLRRENAELRVERDVLKRSVVLGVKEARR